MRYKEKCKHGLGLRSQVKKIFEGDRDQLYPNYVEWSVKESLDLTLYKL